MFFFLFCIFKCLDIKECDDSFNLCKNGGICVNNFGLFMCMCVEGWIGKYCIEGY